MSQSSGRVIHLVPGVPARKAALIIATLVVLLRPVFADVPSISQTAQQRHPAIVKLFGAGVGNLDSYGSGVLVSEDGHFITVWNHLINTGYLTAVVDDGRRFSVKVVGTSADVDLAVLKLESRDEETFEFIDLNSAADVNTGTPVLAFSNMFHVATGDEPVSVVHGIVACESVLKAGLGRWEFPVSSPVYVLDAITNNSGAAGGLLTTVDGRPAGLLGREIRHRETDIWVNYAVPLATLRPVIESLLAGKQFESPDEPDKDLKMIADRRLTADYGLTLLPSVVDRTPAYVDAVVPESQAAKAGFERGDLIVLLNDDAIQSVEEFRRQLSRYRPGERLSITVNRSDVLTTLSLQVP
ncbi:MAG: S1C family serine protease [Planctomycetaceae bacterium]